MIALTPQTRAYLQEHHNAGAVEISAGLATLNAADPRLVQNIPLKAFGIYLVQHGDMDDRLDAAKANPSLPEPVAAGLRKLTRMVEYGQEYFGTLESPEDAQQIDGLLKALVQLGVWTQEEVDGLRAEFGGYQWQRLSEAEVQAILTQWERDALAAALQYAWDEAHDAGKALIEAARIGSGEFPTVLELWQSVSGS